MNRSELERIARKHGTPVVVIDHEEIRRNFLPETTLTRWPRTSVETP